MYKLMRPLNAIIALAVLLAAAVPACPQVKGGPKLSTPDGDVVLELIGQVMNPSPTTSNQYGYFTFVNGINSVFANLPENETNALFTFFTEATTVRVTNNGPLRIVERTGTTTIYYDPAPNGTFSDPNTFRDGQPVLIMTLRQQVILDTAENTTFTTVNINTVTEASTFTVGDSSLRLGKVGDQFRTSLNGRSVTGLPPAGFVIAGYAVAIGKARPEAQ